MNPRAASLRLLAATAIGVWAIGAQAAELRVLAADPVRDVATQIAAEFTQQTGTPVKFTFASVRAIKVRLDARERADVIILTPSVLDELMFSNVVGVGRRDSLGREGLGVVMKAGVKAPDLSTPDALRLALLSAERIAVCNPKSTVTGVQTANLLRRLGIADVVRARTRVLAGANEMMAFLGKGQGTDLGIAPIPAIHAREKMGVQLAAPLPKDLQSYTTYTVAIVQTTRAPKAAEAFLAALTSPQARQRFAAAGFESVP
jgi:molybdate transport system substrate-binding protein